MKLYKNRYTVICDAKTLLQALQNILSEFLLYVYSEICIYRIINKSEFFINQTLTSCMPRANIGQST